MQSSSHILNNSQLPLIEKFINEVTTKLTKKLHIELKLNAKVLNLPSLDNNDGFVVGENVFELSDGTSVESDLTIVAIGSFKKTKNEISGVSLDEKKFVVVDEYLAVNGFFFFLFIIIIFIYYYYFFIFTIFITTARTSKN